MTNRYIARAFLILAVLLAVIATCSAQQPSDSTPHRSTEVAVLGLVAGNARAVLEADWDSTANNPKASERMYEITRDSTASWLIADGSTMTVLVVLEVRPVQKRFADPIRFMPDAEPLHPTIHTHQNYCNMTPWGIDYSTCSNTRAESHQCHASNQDRKAQINEEHQFDVIQCGRDQFVFYMPEGS